MSAAATSITSGMVLRFRPAPAARVCGKRRTHTAQGAGRAAWPARGAPGGAEVHQRLVEVVAAPTRHERLRQCPETRVAAQSPEPARAEEHAAEHAPHVGVEHGGAAAERERQHGARGVPADPRQRAQRVAVVGKATAITRERLARDGVQTYGANVVAERVPQAAHVADVGGGERAQRRISAQELSVLRDHPLDLCLLQHDLGHQHAVGHARASPGQVATVTRIPGEETTLERAHDGLRRRHGAQSSTRRVQWTPCRHALLMLIGPAADDTAKRLTGAVAPEAAWSHVTASLDGVDVRLVRGGGELDAREVWLLTPATERERAWKGAIGAGARPLGAAAVESLRIERGTPRFGADVDASVLLPEIPAERFISHTKGCYPGQEVVVRIRDRGHVNRHLRGLLLDGDLVPPPGAEVVADDAVVGQVTSATLSLGLGRPIALAFVRRQHAPGARVGVRTARGTLPATVSDLPLSR